MKTLKHQPRQSMTRRSRLLSTMLFLILPLSLASCATFGTGTAVSTAAVCNPWKPITYSGTKDTPATTRQIKVHNATGVTMKCW